MSTPLELYQQDIRQHNFIPDAKQTEVVYRTQQLYDELLHSVHRHQNKLALLSDKLLLLSHRQKEKQTGNNQLRGLYLWGGVGRGKTHFVDNFYQSLPFPEKSRMHFHRFMQFIHHELKKLANKPNPLQMVAKNFAQQVRVICLDEFEVFDITDAMLLSGLLKTLFDRQVVLVATSNVAPDDLYKNGLQREYFLPAIDLIKKKTQVILLDNGIDYRSNKPETLQIYYHPLSEKTHQQIVACFEQLAPNPGNDGEIIIINGRIIPTVRRAEGIVWFDFQALCDIPRAVTDYIELAKQFHTVILSNIHGMEEADNDKALRLINLVDEFYDHHVKLILSAQVPPEFLYTGTRQALQFQRTLSRLQEMCSEDYLKHPHCP
jgi:cell division protein ZapE